jgi:alanine dehydrogenase
VIIAILKDKSSSKICLTSKAVCELVEHNHTVLVEGEPRSKLLAPYLNVGAYLINTKEELLDRGDLLIKKTEPELEEIEYLNGEEKIFFTSLNFSHQKLIEKALSRRIAIISYSLLPKIKKGADIASNTAAFSSLTLPFLIELSSGGIHVLVDDEALRDALVIMKGKVYNNSLAHKYGYQWYEF